MAFRIVRKPQAEPQTPYQNRKQRIRQFIQNNEALREMLPQDHPVIQYDPLHVSDKLTYRMTLKTQPEHSGVFNAQIFHLNTRLGNVEQEQAFVSSCYANLRSFLFWTGSDPDNTQNILLIDESGAIQWDGVLEFARRSFEHLPFDLDFIHEDDKYMIVLRSPGSVAVSMTIIPEAWRMEYNYVLKDNPHLYVNEAMGDRLLAQLARAVHSMMTPEQVQQFMNDAQRTESEQKTVNEARAALAVHKGA